LQAAACAGMPAAGRAVAAAPPVRAEPGCVRTEH